MYYSDNLSSRVVLVLCLPCFAFYDRKLLIVEWTTARHVPRLTNKINISELTYDSSNIVSAFLLLRALRVRGSASRYQRCHRLISSNHIIILRRVLPLVYTMLYDEIFISPAKGRELHAIDILFEIRPLVHSEKKMWPLQLESIIS